MTREKERMTIEEKKAYLKSYQKIKREIASLEEEREQIRINKMLPSVNVDGMPKGNGTSDLSDYIAVLDKIERNIQSKTWELINLQHNIEIDIQKMQNETERTLLRMKYLCGKTWEQVAVDMGYSWRGIHNIHSRALRNFKKSA